MAREGPFVIVDNLEIIARHRAGTLPAPPPRFQKTLPAGKEIGGSLPASPNLFFKPVFETGGYFFFLTAFFAAGFLAAAFLAGAFFTAFLAAGFLAAAFLTAFFFTGIGYPPFLSANAGKCCCEKIVNNSLAAVNKFVAAHRQHLF
jgi:hypothetical protein